MKQLEGRDSIEVSIRVAMAAKALLEAHGVTDPTLIRLCLMDAVKQVRDIDAVLTAKGYPQG